MMRSKLENIGELDFEDFEAYCDYMYDGFEVIQKNHIAFIRFREIEADLKMHLLQEMFDFFYLEDDFDRCKELNYWMGMIYNQEYVRSWIYRK